ncbi:hypothetical protein CC86DRAFT_375712 [Ophiobolus disseminans]|uniref:Uncharacterized protein n=1 Tax=Ophiobolus disseminans TaxID=1469910 RepID=A0A6A6ZEI2_9PLEO|nr:hypothetical protein CC86DRAFT_375712 [Ophiobolus disseminans]
MTQGLRDTLHQVQHEITLGTSSLSVETELRWFQVCLKSIAMFDVSVRWFLFNQDTVCTDPDSLTRSHSQVFEQVYKFYCKETCNGLGSAQTYSSTSWDSSCTVMYISGSAHLR